MEKEPHSGNSEAALWNSVIGRNWVVSQAILDRLFKPIEDEIVEFPKAHRPASVLDIGCGTGATTRAIGHALGDPARCTGIDISKPMIAAARAHAAADGQGPEFIYADAQRHDFGEARFALLVSRFGVMFFDEPACAFENLRRAAAASARLKFYCWRSPEDNPFMSVAERAAAPLMTHLPGRDPDGPGQFAFADPVKVRRILSESGWAGIRIEPADFTCTMAEQELVPYFTRLGPVGRVFHLETPETQAHVIESVRQAFEPYIDGGVVHFVAACWNVEARAW